METLHELYAISYEKDSWFDFSFRIPETTKEHEKIARAFAKEIFGKRKHLDQIYWDSGSTGYYFNSKEPVELIEQKTIQFLLNKCDYFTVASNWQDNKKVSFDITIVTHKKFNWLDPDRYKKFYQRKKNCCCCCSQY